MAPPLLDHLDHSLSHSLTRSRTDSLTHSLTHSLTDVQIRQFVHSLERHTRESCRTAGPVMVGCGDKEEAWRTARRIHPSVWHIRLQMLKLVNIMTNTPRHHRKPCCMVSPDKAAVYYPALSYSASQHVTNLFPLPMALPPPATCPTPTGSLPAVTAGLRGSGRAHSQETTFFPAPCNCTCRHPPLPTSDSTCHPATSISSLLFTCWVMSHNTDSQVLQVPEGRQAYQVIWHHTPVKLQMCEGSERPQPAAAFAQVLVGQDTWRGALT